MSRKPNPFQSALKGETKDKPPVPAQAEEQAAISEQVEDSAPPRLRGVVPYAGAETGTRAKRGTAASRDGTYIPPSRAGKAARTHYLPTAYWETLEEVAFRTRDENGKRYTQERLMGEALNLLFQKYNYPIVSE